MPAKKQKALNSASTCRRRARCIRGCGADAAGERREARAHPGGIGPLGGKDIAVGGKLGAPLGRIYGPAARAGGRAGRFIAVVYALLLALASPPRPLRRP